MAKYLLVGGAIMGDDSPHTPTVTYESEHETIYDIMQKIKDSDGWVYTDNNTIAFKCIAVYKQ